MGAVLFLTGDDNPLSFKSVAGSINNDEVSSASGDDSSYRLLNCSIDSVCNSYS
jgi:hypothetical protein